MFQPSLLTTNHYLKAHWRVNWQIRCHFSLQSPPYPCSFHNSVQCVSASQCYPLLLLCSLTPFTSSWDGRLCAFVITVLSSYLYLVFHLSSTLSFSIVLSNFCIFPVLSWKFSLLLVVPSTRSSPFSFPNVSYASLPLKH